MSEPIDLIEVAEIYCIIPKRAGWGLGNTGV